MASVLTAIAGLMNRDGGVVIIGIEDRTNRVIGIEKDISLSTPNKDSDQFITWLENQIISSIGSVKLSLTDIRCELVKEKIVLPVKKAKDIIENISIPEINIPSYKVQRIERLPGVFEQGKIYLIVDNYHSSQSLKRVCEDIVKEYSEFSNFIICLYSSDSAGKLLANGYDEKVSIEEKKHSWLAMYTFNAAEGAYFDDNPTDYLNNY